MDYAIVDSPVGAILVAGTDDAVHEIHFGARRERAASNAPAAVREAAAQLHAYFAGTLRRFDLPLAFAGTDFQRMVWNHLRTIPFGATTTYGAIAQTIGRPQAMRAVGAANGANPIPIVVPCHRVIGANGALTGFGGGIGVKRWLLDHEARVAGRRLF